MGFMDTVRAIFGSSAEHDATREADPEDLFGMSTAYMTMEADLGFPNEGSAALCFSSVDSTDFEDTLREVRDILEAGEAETGTSASIRMDQQGYHWVVLTDSDPEDLVTSIHFAADTFIERGYGSRLLAALFTFRKDSQYVYWVYSFRRGAYYPFAPTRGRERDQSVEFKLQSVLDGELGVEEDTAYWYPMWPESPEKHPWD
ncbi:MAG: hypothetical protein QXG03_01140 [Halalkalicoccus sp.]